ncbi:TetR/AcrR family transcriptional regulator [Clostridium aminobutyricum]|uniref:TetR/AcrR family transcriptional regulator n=1 Tax=Clostridium aminobutyricum TaxID=33953 RepID=A0A939DAT0_CLOAM|nr:TetR/AcrR family transcriptional regulator [Clostridium aminobutyricum]MBN7773888.1 TetR/AcrR family transcriptional regulator [Clostridium aminobutyricum]
MNQDSQRVTETKQKIKKAFLELYREKRIEKISIKEITDRAGVNRGTFYTYYLDIYDLLEQIEEEATEAIKAQAEPIITMLLNGSKSFTDLLPVEFFKNNKELLELFFGEQANPHLLARLKKMAQGIAISKLNLNCDDGTLESMRLRYALEYISSGQIGLITYWFKNEMMLPMSELGRLIEDLNLHGALTYLINHRADS